MWKKMYWLQVVVVISVGWSIPASAATYYWSGTGSWNATNTNWSTTSGGTSGSAWLSGSDAVFEGTAGTVTLSTTYPSSINSLVFSINGYLLKDNIADQASYGRVSTLFLTGDKTIDVASGCTATISAFFNDSGFTKTGEGTLVLDNDVDSWQVAGNSDIYVNEGTLQIADSEALRSAFAPPLLGSGGTDKHYDLTATRNLYVNDGATLYLMARQAFHERCQNTFLVVDGGTVMGSNGDTGTNNQLRNLTLSNGADLAVTKSMGGFATYDLLGTVTVSGTSASTISDAGQGGFVAIGDNWANEYAYYLNGGAGSYTGGETGGAATTFDVADVTADATADLLVYAPIKNDILESALIKIGAGTMALFADNYYTGTTSINAGTLLIDGSLQGMGGAVTVKNGGILSGNGSIFRQVIVESGGFLAPGSSVGSLTIGGDLSLDGVYQWELGSLVDDNTGVAGSDWDMIVLADADFSSGNATIDLAGLVPDAGAFWTADHVWTIVGLDSLDAHSITFNGDFAVTGYTPGEYGWFDVQNAADSVQLTWNTAAVPEPGALAILIGGLLGLVAYAWKKRK